MKLFRQLSRTLIICILASIALLLDIKLYQEMVQLYAINPALVVSAIICINLLVAAAIAFINAETQFEDDFEDFDETEARIHTIEKEQAEQANIIGKLITGRYMHPAEDKLPDKLETRLHDIELELAEISHNYTIMAQSLQAATQKMEHMVNYPASMQQSNNTPSPY